LSDPCTCLFLQVPAHLCLEVLSLKMLSSMNLSFKCFYWLP
jgi:hypothetical protein